MKPMSVDRRVETVSIELLQAHPRQDATFPALSVEQLAELAEDIRVNGLRERIEVMPKDNRAGLAAYTIISGHQRRAALEKNGRKEIDVIVRMDLLKATAQQVEAELINANLQRRQLSKLGQARAAKHLIELERAGGKKGKANGKAGDVRDRVGRVLGMSGKNLERYMKVLATPMPVQQAFEGKQLTLAEATRIAELSTSELDRLSDWIESGIPPRQAMEFFPLTSAYADRRETNVLVATAAKLNRQLRKRRVLLIQSQKLRN